MIDAVGALMGCVGLNRCPRSRHFYQPTTKSALSYDLAAIYCQQVIVGDSEVANQSKRYETVNKSAKVLKYLE